MRTLTGGFRSDESTQYEVACDGGCGRVEAYEADSWDAMTEQADADDWLSRWRDGAETHYCSSCRVAVEREEREVDGEDEAEFDATESAVLGVLSGSREATKLARIVEQVRRSHSSTLSGRAGHVATSYASLQDAVRRLLQDGVVRRARRGYYELTERGREVVRG